MKTWRQADRFTARERQTFQKLTDPYRIQEFLDTLRYSEDPIYRCPRSVLRDRKGHCVDGALFAACALWRLGHPPLIAELRAVRDDDHLLALFRVEGRWGAVAKSNFAGLRYREPIYRSLRELALSYFESYYNVLREKTLRDYSVALDLRVQGAADWMYSDAAVDGVVARLEASRHYALVTGSMVAGLRRVDPRSFEAGLIGANAAGLYDPAAAGDKR
ncbi:MAG: hypothetical protein HY898_20685 [Deltaproteobacteria bacterium]|nr:hypothetical protein [Deltaproteobacteria bacterium]